MTDSKPELRRLFKARLTEALATRREIIDAGITLHAMQLAWPAGSIIACYWARTDEVPTHNLTRKLAAHYTLALPRVDSKDGAMTFRRWAYNNDSEYDFGLAPDALGLLAPPADAAIVTPAIVLAPLVAYDDALTRLGQGGGYYDRAMAALSNATLIGLACTAQYSPVPLPAAPHDRPMALVINEHGVITPKL